MPPERHPRDFRRLLPCGQTGVRPGKFGSRANVSTRLMTNGKTGVLTTVTWNARITGWYPGEAHIKLRTRELLIFNHTTSFP